MGCSGPTAGETALLVLGAGAAPARVVPPGRPVEERPRLDGVDVLARRGSPRGAPASRPRRASGPPPGGPARSTSGARPRSPRASPRGRGTRRASGRTRPRARTSSRAGRSSSSSSNAWSSSSGGSPSSSRTTRRFRTRAYSMSSAASSASEPGSARSTASAAVVDRGGQPLLGQLGPPVLGERLGHVVGGHLVAGQQGRSARSSRMPSSSCPNRSRRSACRPRDPVLLGVPRAVSTARATGDGLLARRRASRRGPRPGRARRWRRPRRRAGPPRRRTEFGDGGSGIVGAMPRHRRSR